MLHWIIPIAVGLHYMCVEYLIWKNATQGNNLHVDLCLADQFNLKSPAKF